jgi:hypothetical protein
MLNAPWVAIHKPRKQSPRRKLSPPRKKINFLSGGVPLRIFSSIMKVRVGKVEKQRKRGEIKSLDEKKGILKKKGEFFSFPCYS